MAEPPVLIRPAFATTITKSKGKTVKNMGVLLHGQVCGQNLMYEVPPRYVFFHEDYQEEIQPVK